MTIAKTLRWVCKPAFLVSQIILILAVSCSPVPLVVTPTIQMDYVPTNNGPTLQPQVGETQLPISTLAATPVAPKAVIKIVSHVPLSGDQAGFGEDMLHATQLAIQQLSGPLSELGYQVELATYDDQNLIDTALTNAQQIAADSQILCGVGHYDAAVTIAASNPYHQAGLAFVAPTTADPILTDRSFLEVNRLIGRLDGQGTVAAQFAKDQGFTSFYTVSQSSQMYVRNADAFRVEAGKLGLKRLGSLTSNLTGGAMGRYIKAIVKAQPDVVYIAAATQQGVPFLAQLRAAGYMGAFLGTERLNSRSAISEAGPSLVEGGGLFYTIVSPPAKYYSDASQFRSDFQAQFGTAPRSVAARVYDATGVCLKAIEEASRAKGGELPTRSEVAKSLRAIADYKGITGTYTFNDHGDPDPVQYYLFQVITTDPANWNQNSVVASYQITPP